MAYCLDDGMPLADESTISSQETLILPRRKSRFLPVFFGLLLLAGAIGTGWFVFQSSQMNAETVQKDNNQTAIANIEPSPILSPSYTPTPIATPTAADSPTPEEIAENETISEETPVSSTPPKSSDEPSEPLMKIEANQVVFDLRQCRKTGTTIICDFVLTNNGEDRRLFMRADSSRLFDELGNGYDGKTIKLANQSSYRAEIGFVSGVTTKAQIIFENIEPTSKQITLLDVGYVIGNSYGENVQFRNVPLLKGK